MGCQGVITGKETKHYCNKYCYIWLKVESMACKVNKHLLNTGSYQDMEVDIILEVFLKANVYVTIYTAHIVVTIATINGVQEFTKNCLFV